MSNKNSTKDITSNIKSIGLIFSCWIIIRFLAGFISNLTDQFQLKILAIISIFLFTCANALLAMTIIFFLIYIIKKGYKLFSK